MHSSRGGSQTSPNIPVFPSPAPTRGELPRWRVWLLALRLPTLPAAVVPVLVGSASAFSAGTYRPLVFLAALISALLIQIGTNFANDLFDFKKGADTEQRLGPTRVTQAGLLSEADVKRGTILTFALAFISGLYLVFVGGWPILAIGLLGIAAGVMYTGGPWPLGYHGLGDVFVFLFFGVIAVAGTHYVHTGGLTWHVMLASLPVALLATAILVVNNLRDIETDRAAGKRTLAVRIGPAATRVQYTLCVLVPYVACGVLWMQSAGAFWLPWLTLPFGLLLVVRVLRRTQGTLLNPVLKQTGQLHLLFGLLMAGSYLL